MSDFFFKSVQLSEQGASFQMEALLRDLDGVSPAFAVKQLNRLLSAHNGRVTIRDLCSTPALGQLFKALNMQEVGKVEIYPVSYNDDHVRAVIHCDLIFESGCVTIETYASAHKTLSAVELVYNVLFPIHRYGLTNRTMFCNQTDSTPIHPTFIGIPDRELKALFNLALHPSALQMCDEDLQRFKMASQALAVADQTYENSCDDTAKQIRDLKEALGWALDYIDAIPQDTEFPAMPGFDRDYVDNLRK